MFKKILNAVKILWDDLKAFGEDPTIALLEEQERDLAKDPAASERLLISLTLHDLRAGRSEEYIRQTTTKNVADKALAIFEKENL